MVQGRAPRVRARVSPSVMDYLARLEQRAAFRAPTTDPSKLQRYLRRVEGNTPPAEPLADMLNRNERTRTLLESRVDRLTPEQQQGSLASIWVQAQREAAEAAAAQRAAQARQAERMAAAGRIAAHPLAVSGATAAAIGGGMALPTTEGDAPPAAEPELLPWGGEREADIVPPGMDLGDHSMGDMVMDMVDDEVDPFEPEILLNPGDEALVDSYVRDDGPLPDWWTKRTVRDYATPLGMPSPEESSDMAPGPESPVATPDDLETLPGPQLRSIKALMRGGIPEGRARDIILRGSSMSPDEYRLVTGGRR